MKKSILFFSFLFVLDFCWAQNFGSWSSAVYMQVGGNTKFYNCNSNTIGSIQFSGSLGTFTQDGTNLTMVGAEIKTWKKETGDVCTPSMKYRVYITGSPSGSFSSFDLGFYCNCSGVNFLMDCGGGGCSGSDQKWQSPGTGSGQNINLLNRAPGNYTLEVYYDVPGSDIGGGCGIVRADNNGGVNYSIIFTVQAPMPITLVNLDVKKINSVHKLVWTTSSEINNDYFEVQYSEDGNTFQSIGQVKGAGNSGKVAQYQFMHDNPKVGTTYYRLKQVDFDGKFEYSPMKSIYFSSENVRVFPNPVTDRLHLSGLIDTPVKLIIKDMTGKEVYSEKELSSTTIDLSGLKAGMYTIYFIDNHRTISQRFVKQ
jgi:Secretion system C-terminal sorting domain